jgi:outer membrane protein OmpA-like peptidoglycan-associated protein
MVTLLLTFFVLLLTISETQDPELFNRGRDSFWQSIQHCGLGALLGSKETVELGEDRPKYKTTEPETSEDRSLDEYRAKLQQIFDRLNQSTTTLPSQLVGQQLDFAVTDVRFRAGEFALDAASKGSLSRLCLNLTQTLSGEHSTVYVLGLSGEEGTAAQQWLLSAKRARTVAHFLQETLAWTSPDGSATGTATGSPPWRVHWWGAGPGGNWAGQDSPDPGQSQILVAVLKTDL